MHLNTWVTNCRCRELGYVIQPLVDNRLLKRRTLAIVDMKPHYLRPISAVLPTWVVDSLRPRLFQVDERAVVVPGLAGKLAR